MQLTNRQAVPLISGISVAIPIVVALLLYTPAVQVQGLDPYLLPLLNAVINTTVSVLLVLALIFIRQGRVTAHKICMLSSVVLSAIFLISYVVYHAAAEETKFGGQGFIRVLYFFILISHILLAVVIVPLVLFTLYRALTNQFGKHKKLARWTFPLWLYVSITGVVLYLMISPYFPS